ncbi:unnamed protein product [Rhizophagus irregularis]|nr:unnamed protein product [Rhizophagus irregularis]
MHSYNPLEKADTIAVIVQKLPIKTLDKFSWINSTWYKEIQHEFRRRWKIQVLEYNKLECKREFKMDEVERKYPYDYFMQGLFQQDIENFYTEREIETAKKQVEIESYMLRNGMLHRQKKEIVKYNIQKIAENVVPWNGTDAWKLSELLEKNNLFI